MLAAKRKHAEPDDPADYPPAEYVEHRPIHKYRTSGHFPTACQVYREAES